MRNEVELGLILGLGFRVRVKISVF